MDRPKGLMVDAFASALERSNRRFFIVCVILIAALIITNFAWTLYYDQYETTTVSIEAEQMSDGDSANYIVGGNYGGETESQNSEKDTCQEDRR